MTINILFNFPLGENSARFSLGFHGAGDAGHEFRLGVIEKTDATTIKWLAPGWIQYGETQKLDGFIKKGDVLVAESRDAKTKEPYKKVSINTEKEWPSDAAGNSSADINFTV